MSFTRRNLLAGVAAGAVVLAAGSVAMAADYPSKPIRLVVGYQPGGGSDTLARLLAASMSKELGQQVVVENRPGANGNIATAEVGKAKADGYTLLFSNVAQIVVSPATYETLPHDPIEGIRHLAMVGDGDYIFGYSATKEFATGADFIAAVKADSSLVKFGSSGAGGISHLAGEMLAQQAGINLKSIHYKGSGGWLPELIAGEIDIAVDGAVTMGPNFASGTIKPLMVASPTRSEFLPDVPSSTELGLADFPRIANWFGLHGPLGLPQDVEAKLLAALDKSLASTELQGKMFTAGVKAVDLKLENFADRIRTEAAAYKDIAKQANIKVE